MELEDFKTLAVGDLIEFRSPTRHSTRKAQRLVTGFPTNFDYDNLVDGEFPRSTDHCLVRFEGSPNFYVRRREIIRVVARNGGPL